MARRNWVQALYPCACFLACSCRLGEGAGLSSHFTDEETEPERDGIACSGFRCLRTRKPTRHPTPEHCQLPGCCIGECVSIQDRVQAEADCVALLSLYTLPSSPVGVSVAGVIEAQSQCASEGHLQPSSSAQRE